jgi:gluconokinase
MTQNVLFDRSHLMPMRFPADRALSSASTLRRMASGAVHVVVMGVAGCGKSAVAQRIAAELGLPLIEGDDFHSPGSVRKMRNGVPLKDADREDWLRKLAHLLADAQGGAVLTCSALKRAYRDKLRAAVPTLQFVYLEISREESLRRVAGRADHFYPPSLVASQFEALENPAGEAGVQVLDGAGALDAVAREACGRLRPAIGIQAG